MWWIIILGIIGYILLWGLTTSLLYKFFDPFYEECFVLGVIFPITLPLALVAVVFNIFNKLLKNS